MAKQQNPQGLVSENTEYDDYIDFKEIDPGLAQIQGTEEPDTAEQAHYDSMHADFIDELYDNQTRNVEQIVGSAAEVYQGVSDAAFAILQAVYQKHDQRDGPVPQAAMFGEGGMIHTAVDEVFQFAAAKGIDGTDDQQNYMAAQIDMMKKVGEHIEQTSDDGAVEEAQSLLIDMEMADPNYEGEPQPLGADDLGTLRGIGEEEEAPPEMVQQAGEVVQGAQGAAPPDVQQDPAANVPPAGGLIG